MDFIEMGQDLSLGVPELDKQHQELALRLNDAIKHCTGKRADEREFYKKNTPKSIELLKKHFETEEKLLKKTKYDNFSKHKAEHKEMLTKLKKMTSDIDKNRIELDLFYLTAFTKEMVMKHFRTSDMKAKKFINVDDEK
ncbi:MAG: hypothetical protein FWF55_01165 [Treponema sp.]|nr:hypothetical protein [Treponema sp.]